MRLHMRLCSELATLSLVVGAWIKQEGGGPALRCTATNVGLGIYARAVCPTPGRRGCSRCVCVCGGDETGFGKLLAGLSERATCLDNPCVRAAARECLAVAWPTITIRVSEQPCGIINLHVLIYRSIVSPAVAIVASLCVPCSPCRMRIPCERNASHDVKYTLPIYQTGCYTPVPAWCRHSARWVQGTILHTASALLGPLGTFASSIPMHGRPCGL